MNPNHPKAKATQSTNNKRPKSQRQADTRANQPKDQSLKSEIASLKRDLRLIRQASNPSVDASTAASLAAYLMDPFDHKPMRYPDAYSAGDSSMVTPWHQETAIWPDEEAYDMPYLRVFAFRDPMRAFIVSRPSPQPYANTYVGTPQDLSHRGYFQRLITTSPGEFDLAHGHCIYPGVSGGSFFYMAQQTDRFRLGLNEPQPAERRVVIKYYNETFPEVVVNIPANAPGIDPLPVYPEDAHGPIFFCVYVQQGDSGIPGVYMTMEANIGDRQQEYSYYCQRCLPGIHDYQAVVDESRITAVSVLITNTSNVLTRGGQVTGYQVPGANEWTKYLNFDFVSSCNKSQTLAADKGIYGFLKVTQPEDLRYQPSTFFGAHAYDMDNNADFLTFNINVPRSVGGSGRSFKMYFTFGVEFKTDSIWFTKYIVDPNTLMVDQVLRIMAHLRQFHENPLHWKDIQKAISRFLGGVVKYAPVIAKGAAVVASLL